MALADTDKMAPNLPSIELPPRDWLASIKTWALWFFIAGLLAWSYYPAEVNNYWLLVTDSDNMVKYLNGFWPPNFADGAYYLEEMILTVQIAIWGTALSLIAAVPFGILSSTNMVPVYIYQPVRRLMDGCRAINELVFAVLFVVAVGLGPFAGVLALFVHTTGVLAKLFSEAVEAIDPRPVEAIKATGATRVQQIIYGVIPQVLPLWISYALYRFESNTRSATILGVVGAGGIGQILFESIRGFQYAESAAILLIIIISVIILDMVSQLLRKMVI